MLKRPLIWVPLLLVLLVGAVVFASRWFVPSIVRSQSEAYFAQNFPGKQISMGAVAFDPLSLTLAINDLAVGDAGAGNKPMVRIRRLVVDASSASLFKLTPRLDTVLVEGASVDAVLRKDGSLNLVELVPPDDGEPIPEVWIGDLQVKDSEIGFTDARGDTPRSKRLKPVAFQLQNFATTATEGGGFKLDAASDEGETFAWAGKLSMAPLASAGRFEIGALKLSTIGKFAGDMLPVSLGGGSLSLAGTYSFAAPPGLGKNAPPPMTFDAEISRLGIADAAVVTADGDSVAVKSVALAPTKLSLAGDTLALGDVQIVEIRVIRASGETVRVGSATLAATRYGMKSGVAELGAADVNSVSVRARGAKTDAVTLAALAIAPSRLDMPNSQADLGVITARGLRVSGDVSKTNEIRIPGLYPMPGGKPAAKAVAAPAWNVSLAGFQLEDAGVKLAVARPGNKAPGMLNFAPIRASIGPATSKLDAPLSVDVSTGINGKAKASAKGKLSPKNGSADLAVALTGLPLVDVLALGPTPPGVMVTRGTAGASGQLTVRPAKAGPQIAFAGDANIANFSLEETNGADLVSWARLDLRGIRYRPAPASLSIARINFDRPSSAIVISRQAQLNVARAAGVEQPAQAEPAAAAKDGETAAATASPETAKPADPAAPGSIKVEGRISSGLSAAGSMIPISIGEVRVKGGIIAFEDQSIEPNFSAKIQGLNGTVRGLSTRPGSQAQFDLNGFIIDRFSPVSINGRANVFAYDANTDLTASFQNIELPVFNPYSGRFAGYSIAKGKLSTTINYKINNRALDAQHNVVIEQLEWGAATDSKDKVSLPIRLATSLLKDSNGVIDLDLPVGGTLDDPSFKIWPVIWQVVGNVMTKLVTAPFKLIGSLFAGADEAQFIVFEPGSAVLSPEASANLAALAKGLLDRKEVNLEIPAGPGIREDADVMTIAALEAAAVAAKKGKPVGFADLDPEAKADRLKAVYKAKTGKGPKFPEGEVAKAGMFAGKDAKSAAATAQVDWLIAELKPKFAPTDAQLAALGQARAGAVKEALLASGELDPARVFLSTNAAVQPKDAKVAMEIGVK